MMISRKKILSRSQSEVEYPSDYNPYECEEDIWFNREKLFSDHVQEILRKWEQIDDEIWGKIICMERNRRVAKAYARVPVLTINGSEDGFDGYKIGLNGFETPLNDSLVKRVKQHIGKGVRVKIDDLGNVIIKRMSNCDVFIRGWDREANSLSKDIVELNGELEFERSVKLFDMKKFQNAISKELRSAYPDRRRLEHQCVLGLAFVKDASDVLDLPVWCMIINIVALDMLKSRMPPAKSSNGSPNNNNNNNNFHRVETVPKFVNVFERSSSQEEDPYSVPTLPGTIRGGVGTVAYMKKATINGQDQKPPELPPRDLSKIKKGGTKGKGLGARVFRSLVKDNSAKSKAYKKQKEQEKLKQQLQQEQQFRKQQQQQQQQHDDYEDPYYSGMQARVSKFNAPRDRGGKSIAFRQMDKEMRKSHSSGYLNSLFSYKPVSKPAPSNYSYYDSNFESDPYALSSADGYDLYDPIYGRIRNAAANHRMPSAFPYTSSRNAPYTGEWD